MVDLKKIAITSGLLPVAGLLTALDKNESFQVVSEETEITTTSTKKSSNTDDPVDIFRIIQYLIMVIIFFGAIYLSFKCNDGFHLGDLLLACCCSPRYLVYRLAIPCRPDRRYLYRRGNNIGRMR